MRATFAYALTLFGCYLLYQAGQEHPINPLTIGAIMPLVLTGPATSGDMLLKRLQAAGKALVSDPPDSAGDRAPAPVASGSEPPETGS